MDRCGFTKPSGQRCKGRAIEGSEYCWNHAPEYAEARSRAGRKGGKRGGRGRPMAELGDIKDRLREIAEDVRSGALDRGDAAVISQIYNVYLRAVSVELKARDQLELEQRLADLEALLEARKQSAYG